MNNKNLAKLFFILSMLVGIILVFIVPPFNSPDEDSHFLYAYEISKGNFFPTTVNHYSGYYVPSSFFNYINEIKKLENDRDNKYKYSEIYFDQMLSQDYSQTEFSRAVIQSDIKIAYLAPALGIQLTDYMSTFSREKVSISVMLQFARFFSLLAYSIIGYFAIKITPKFKKSFFVILLLPMSVFLRSMVTYDGILLVITALAIANMLKLIYNKEVKFSTIDWIIFLITGFILLNVKIVYSIVFLGLFAIPDNVFGTRQKKIKTIFTMAAIILFVSIVRKTPYLLIENTGNDTLQMQVKFILNNPIQYLKILARSIIGQWKTQEYWMIGTYGLLDTYMPVLFVFLMKIFLIFVFIFDASLEKIKLPLWLKLGLLFLIIFDICGIYTKMYISWTPLITGEYGGNIITGVQGRYYLPFLLLIPLILNNNLISKIKNKKINNFINILQSIYENNFHYVTLTSLILMIIFIFMRYYC